MDEGLPISYEVLREGVPVYSSDGQVVGTVASVLSAPEEDIFHGLLIHEEGKSLRFVETSSIAPARTGSGPAARRFGGPSSCPRPSARRHASTDARGATEWSRLIHRARSGGTGNGEH